MRLSSAYHFDCDALEQEVNVFAKVFGGNAGR